MLGEKRRILHKFLDLIDGIEAANKWSTSALSHLSRQEDPRSSLTDEDVSTLSNKRGGWNKRGGGGKVAKSINVDIVIL